MIWEQDCWQNCPSKSRQSIVNSIWDSRKPSTVSKYCLSLRKFFQYCKDAAVPVTLPLPSIFIAQYLDHLKQRSANAVREAISGLKWLHYFVPGLNPSNNPLNDEFLSRIVESTRRNETKEKSRKKPLTTEIISNIVKNLVSSPTLTEIRDALIPSLTFALLLRHDELSHLNFNHFSNLAGGLKIHIPSSKTDTFREGKYVFLAKENSIVYNLIFQHTAKAGLDFNANHFFFGPIVITKGKMKLQNNILSYEVYNQIIKKAVSIQGLNPDDFGTHSARSGGATALFPSANQFELMLSGRWADPRSLGSYVEIPDDSRFELNSRLNLN